MYGQYRQGANSVSIVYREVVHYSECPLLEVPLYCSQIQPNLSCQEAVRDYILFKMALYTIYQCFYVLKKAFDSVEFCPLLHRSRINEKGY